jgi:hypothetical protein
MKFNYIWFIACCKHLRSSYCPASLRWRPPSLIAYNNLTGNALLKNLLYDRIKCTLYWEHILHNNKLIRLHLGPV